MRSWTQAFQSPSLLACLLFAWQALPGPMGYALGLPLFFGYCSLGLAQKNRGHSGPFPSLVNSALTQWGFAILSGLAMFWFLGWSRLSLGLSTGWSPLSLVPVVTLRVALWPLWVAILYLLCCLWAGGLQAWERACKLGLRVLEWDEDWSQFFRISARALLSPALGLHLAVLASLLPCWLSQGQPWPMVTFALLILCLQTTHVVTICTHPGEESET